MDMTIWKMKEPVGNVNDEISPLEINCTSDHKRKCLVVK